MKSQKTTLEITAPAATPIGLAVRTFYKLPGSKLRHVSVGIPAGHHALAQLQISVPGYGIIIPGGNSNVQFVRGENDRIEFDLDVNLDAPSNTLEARVFNDDALLDHVFILNIDTELMQ